MKKLITVALLTFVQLNAVFKFSDPGGKILVTPGSNIELTAPITNFGGNLVISSSATVGGQTIAFAGGSLQDSSGATVSGANFTRDLTSTSAATGTNGIILSGGQTLDVSGPVPCGIFVSGSGNTIKGSPIFSGPITLDSSSPTTLDMAISSECNTNIDLNGQLMRIVKPLTMSPGKQIKSTTGPININLNNQSLSLGGVAGAYTAPINMSGGGTINITSDIAPSGAWQISGNTTISSNGSALDLSATNASISIAAGANVELQNMTLSGVQTGKIIFADNTSGLKITRSKLQLSGAFHQTTGSLVTNDATISVGQYPFTQDPAASFSNDAGGLWVDTGSSQTPPVFGQIDSSTGKITTYMDNETVRQTVDFNQVTPAPNRELVSGNLNQDLTINTNVTLAPAQAIIATTDSTVTAAGINFNFNDTSSSQLVVKQDKTLTIAGDATFTTNPSTFNIEPNATLSFNGNTKINLQGDTSIPSGTINVIQPSPVDGEQQVQSLTLSGPGGTTRFGLSAALPTTSNPNPKPAKINVDSGELVIKNMDFYGLENVVKKPRIVNGVKKDGQITLAGNAKVHVRANTDMNFHIVGEGNYLVIEKNEVTLSGNFNFDDNGNNELFIRFDLDTVVDQPTIKFGPRSMTLFSNNGIAKLIFDDPEVFVTLLDSTSFVTGGHASIDGFRLTIQQNPIVQTSSDLALGDVDLLTDGIIDSPLLFTGIDDERGRNPDIDNYIKSKILEKPNFGGSIDNFFKNTALNRAMPRPNLRIIKSMTLTRAKGVIRLLPGAEINSFGTDDFTPLTLQLTGKTRITPIPRRQKRTVNPIRSNIFREGPSFTDRSYTDTIKENDAIYVSGTDNIINITGNMVLACKLIMDENAELIFKFDDSVDTPKAIAIDAQDENGNTGLILPANSSIVFDGRGQVIFKDQSSINFEGSLPSQVADTGTFLDNRPSLIFKNYASLSLEQGQSVRLAGKGQCLFQQNAELLIPDGWLVVGASSSDLFDLTFDQGAICKVGSADSTPVLIDNLTTCPGRLSLAHGDFSIKFNNASEMLVRDGGIIETCLKLGAYTGGHISNFIFAAKSTLNLSNSGRLAFAQSNLTGSGSAQSNFYFNNIDGEVSGSGFALLYTQFSTEPFVEGQIHSKTFNIEGGSALEVFKRFTRNAKLRSEIFPNPNLLGLEQAADLYDSSGNYNLLTNQNSVVELEPGDIIRREATGGGPVFGTSSAGVNFVIQPDGSRQNI